jgi:hypothetical protein
MTRRTCSRRIEHIAKELRNYLLGWKAYFGVMEIIYPHKELDSWVKRKLHCYLWKQWDRGGYEELRKRGVSRNLAWNTCKSAHGPWRLSRSPALAFALPASYFVSLGVPRLFIKRPSQPNHLGTWSVCQACPTIALMRRRMVWEEGSREAPPYPD